ncbi:MAG: hypothetical protein ACE5OZ_11905 [Candidatus Heimdallarchaeota archaeon]
MTRIHVVVNKLARLQIRPNSRGHATFGPRAGGQIGADCQFEGRPVRGPLESRGDIGARSKLIGVANPLVTLA